MTSNLAHILHRVQLIGKMSLEKFESTIDPDQYKKCVAKVKSKKQNTWYTLITEAILDYFYMVFPHYPHFAILLGFPSFIILTLSIFTFATRD